MGVQTLGSMVMLPTHSGTVLPQSALPTQACPLCQFC